MSVVFNGSRMSIRCDFCESWKVKNHAREHRFPPDVNPNCVPDGWLYVERPLPRAFAKGTRAGKSLTEGYHPKHVCPTCIRTEIPE